VNPSLFLRYIAWWPVWCLQEDPRKLRLVRPPEAISRPDCHVLALTNLILGRRQLGRTSPPTPYWSISSSFLKFLIYSRTKTLSSSPLEKSGTRLQTTRLVPIGGVFVCSYLCPACKRGLDILYYRGGVLIVPIPLGLRSAGNGWTNFSGPSSGPVRRSSIWRECCQTNVVVYSFLPRRWRRSGQSVCRLYLFVH
jgi:hypothetical protein